jgi:glucose-1-phosphate thymidylyltransferase
MKAVIPVAGIGMRLRPHTFTVPKALLNVAGKPILGHIMDSLLEMGVEELIPIIGYKGGLIRSYLDENYDIPITYVVQKEQKGIAHAVSMTREHADDSALVIMLGDTIIKTDFRSIPLAGEAVLGVHRVEDPRRFGVCQVENGIITSIVEKPDEPLSDLALIGLYYFENSAGLYEACAEIIEKDIRTKGEYQITDALQMMIERGVEFKPYEIDGWFDCGKVETLLETNRVLLDDMEPKDGREGSIVVQPCYIDAESVIENSIIGPYVTVAKGSEIRHSIIENSILNEGAKLENVILSESVVGAYAEVRGRGSSLNVSDHSQIDYR